MSDVLSVLKNRNYALYFTGQFFSLSGTWMQMVVQSWLVYRLSNSGAWLGVIAFCSQVPAFLMSPIAGYLADQKDRRTILITAYIFGLAQAFVLALLVFLGRIEVWHIALLSIGAGVINAFDITTRHAFAVDIVGKGQLRTAIALNTALINGSRVVGPAVGGILIGVIGEGWCFVLNGLTYLVVIYGLLAMQLPRKPKVLGTGRPVAEITEAMRYVMRTPGIRNLLVIATLLAFASSPYMVLLPMIVKEVLQGDAHVLGWLNAMNGVGAVVGALLSVRQSVEGSLGRKVMINTWLIGMAMLALGMSRVDIAALVSIFFVGFFTMSTYPLINNAIQQTVTDALRGRVMSVYVMTFLGASPLGGLVAGGLSERYGVVTVVLAAGAMCIVVGLLLLGVRLRNH